MNVNEQVRRANFNYLLNKKIDAAIQRLIDTEANVEVSAVATALHDLARLLSKSKSPLTRGIYLHAIHTMLSLLPGGDC